MEKVSMHLMSGLQVAVMMGISMRTFHELRERPDFPKPIVLGPRTVRWVMDEIEQYLMSLPRQAINGYIEPAHLTEARMRNRIEIAMDLTGKEHSDEYP